MNNHLVISSDIVAVTIEGTPGSIDPTIPGYSVDDVFVYPTAIIALGNAQSSVFALSASGNVGFAIPDSPLWDNAGGMSLRITLETTMSIFPKTGGDTGFVSVHIFGTGFEEGATVKLTRDGESDIFGEPVTVSENGALINTTFDLTGKERSLWNVVITNPDSTTFTIPNGFTIEKGRDAELWVDILGSQFIRPEREQAHWINYGNKSNVDVFGAHLFLKIPPNVEFKLKEDTEFNSLITGVVNHIYISRISANNSAYFPISLKVNQGQPNFEVSVAISNNLEKFRILHVSDYHTDFGLNFEKFLNADYNAYISAMEGFEEYKKDACPGDPMALLAGGNEAPTGYVDLFIVKYPGEDPFDEVGIRLGDYVSWSYPEPPADNPGICESPDGCVFKVKFADFEFENGIGHLPWDETVTVKHVWSIRPGSDEDLANITWLEKFYEKYKGTRFCDPGGDGCVSCIGYVMQALYPPEPCPEDPEKNCMPERLKPIYKNCYIDPEDNRKACDYYDFFNYWLNQNECKIEDIIDQEGQTLEDWKNWFEDEKRSLQKSPVTSIDPNDKIGSQGVGEAKHISGEEPLRYAIFFENLETATASAQEVIITDQLELTAMDLSTLSLGPITFGDKLLTPPPGLQDFTAEVDLQPENDLIVRITASLNTNTSLLTWSLTSIDPETGLPPDDPLAGFLPPNVNPPEGEGAVLFTVMPKAGLVTGTEIKNSASIVFDTNDPIITPEWLNTIDNNKPTSQVLPLNSTQISTDFEVQWTGEDEGEGIRDYTIFVSEDNGPYTKWLTNTPDTSGIFSGQNGKTYAFYSVARDQTDNLEDAPEAPDTTTTVVTNQPPVAQCQDVTVPTDPSTCAAGTASVDNGSSDPDGDPITLDQSPPGSYPLGDNAVTLTVMDDKSASDSCDATVTVIDQEPPVINNLAANPNVLWPPDHKMRPVTVTADASDNCDSDPVCKIISVSSNEPVNGTGDGDKSPDWEITGDLTVNLRAERAGSGSGRVYTITVGCTDDIGNSATAEATVTVPHNQ